MGTKTVSLALPEEFIATIDEIASGRDVARDEILRDALALYLADYQELQADLKEGMRQIEAGETVPHDEVKAWFQAQHAGVDKSEAA
jgi:predicted transcriptional regulator